MSEVHRPSAQWLLDRANERIAELERQLAEAQAVHDKAQLLIDNQMWEIERMRPVVEAATVFEIQHDFWMKTRPSVYTTEDAGRLLMAKHALLLKVSDYEAKEKP
jgi:hypothetical protein